MNSKIFLSLILSIFLISIASATIVVDGYFQNDIYETQAEINNGESITIHAIFSSTDSITSKEVNLPYGLSSDSGACSVSSSGHTYSCTYTITSSNVGTYTIDIIGTDNTGSTDSQTLRLIVNHCPIPPENNAPEITSSPVTHVDEGDFYTYHVTATDEDGDALNYSLISAPSWLSINSATGVISGTAPLVSSDAHLDIEVKVSDGNGGIDTQSYILTVKNEEEGDTTPPVITIISPEENCEYDTCKLKIEVHTNEHAEVTFGLDEGVVIEMNNPSDNKFTYTLNDLSEGKHHLTFYAEDDEGNEAHESTSFDIKNCEKKCEDDDCTKSSARFIQSSGHISSSYDYEQAQYVNQFHPSGMAYSDTSSSSVQKTAGALVISVSTLLYIILAVVGLGIIIAFFVIFRNIRR